MRFFDYLIQIAFAIGVAFILPIVVYQGIEIFNPSPVLEKYNVNKNEGYKKVRGENIKGYNEARIKHDKILFYIATSIGIVAILVGAYFPIVSLGTGLVLGGLACSMLGSFYYWEHMDHVFKFGIMLLMLVILLVIGYFISMKASTDNDL